MSDNVMICLFICIAVVIVAICFMITMYIEDKTYVADRKRIEELEKKVSELYNSFDT